MIGEWKCPEYAEDGGDGGDAGDANETVEMPWATGFEDRFCDYTQLGGFCYARGLASYRLVTSPVHSGQFAAAFTATANNDSGVAQQVRCVRQGTLPNAAVYGAWFYVPEQATNRDVWNLFHFRGGTGAGHGLWDASLSNAPSGELRIRLYDHLRNRNIDGPAAPIATWFHVELYLKRAKDATGVVVLYLDGNQVVSRTNLITDDTDWGQWHVGNYVTELAPPDSTVYVDDITIGAAP